MCSSDLVGQKLKVVEITSVAFFFVNDMGAFICTNEGNKYGLDLTLDKLEPLLDPHKFFRINRQYIVSFDSIKNMHILSNRSIKLDLVPKPDDEIVTVSIHRLSEFKNWLNK